MSKHSLKHTSRRFRRFLRANEAVSALEYAIMVGVVSVALLGAFTVFNTEIKTAIGKIGENIRTNTANTGSNPPAPSPF